MTHYIVVRRDLPLGAVLANVAHAAGESFYALNRPGSSEERAFRSNGEVAGSNPAPGSTTPVVFPGRLGQDAAATPNAGETPARGANLDPSQTVVVVLGARNEHRLARLVRSLTADGIAFVAIREPDAPWHGQLMAVGLVPGDRDQLAPYVNDFHMFPDPQ